MIFRYPAINPIRLLKQSVDVDNFWYKPFDLQESDLCYHQPFTTSDITFLQFLSDYTIDDNGLTCNIYNAETSELALNVVPVLKPVNIIDQTFGVYELEIDFSAIPEGFYYVEIEYTDENDQEVIYQSEALEIKEEHENTILVTYKNTENDFEAVFDTGIEFSLRLPGIIADFQPEFDDVIYSDQKRNVTKLNSVPYRTFKLYVSHGAAGVPDWFIDIVNQSFSCDQLMLDGQYFEKVEGANWEPKRAEPEYPFAGWQIEITPVENILFRRLKTGAQPPTGYTVVEKVKNYFGNAADLAVANTFRKYSLLKNITIINYGDAFTLNVGVTDGGNEIGTFEIDEDGNINLSVHVVFRASTTLYFSGLEDTTADIMLDYLQYDESPIGAGSTIGVNEVPIGTIFEYEEPNPGDLELDFDLVTGLGNSSRGFAKYAICDGRNGTRDRRGRISLMYDPNNADYEELWETGGSDSFTISSLDNLPQFRVKLLSESVNPHSQIPTGAQAVARAGTSGNSLAYELRRGDGDATLGQSSAIGKSSPDAITHMPPYIVSLFIKKIS